MDEFFHGGYEIDEGEAVLWDEDAEDDGRPVFVSGEFIQDFPWDHATRDECRSAALSAVDQKLEEQLELWNGQQEGEDRLSGPVFYYPTLAWSNVFFDPRFGVRPLPQTKQVTGTYFNVPAQRIKYRRILTLLLLVRDLLIEGAKLTKRELYYFILGKYPDLFPNQAELDRIVNLLSVMLRVPRAHLNIFATSKGLMAGNIEIITAENTVIRCLGSTEGCPIPQDVKGIKEIHTEAKAILVVEKDAVFQSLLDDPLFSSHLDRIVMLTGKGVPDLSTRQLAHELSFKRGIPSAVLVDCDPYGLEIMLVYKYGSLSMAWSVETTAVPAMQWIGVLPEELTLLDEEQRLAFSQADHSKLHSLLARPYLSTNAGPEGDQHSVNPNMEQFQPEESLIDEGCAIQQLGEREGIRHQLEVLKHLEVKAEIESLHRPARYILQKLANLGLIDQVSEPALPAVLENEE